MGATQNNNESLHSKIWAKCPKTGFMGLQRVVAATCTAVAEFNSGVKTTLEQLCTVMGITSGPRLLASAEKADRKRVRQSVKQQESRTKEARRARKVARATAATAADYAAGEF